MHEQGTEEVQSIKKNITETVKESMTAEELETLENEKREIMREMRISIPFSNPKVQSPVQPFETYQKFQDRIKEETIKFLETGEVYEPLRTITILKMAS